jgi:glucoamylase
LRSISDGKVFSTPPQTVQRYLKNKVKATYAIWRTNHRCREIPFGKNLRIQTECPAKIRWTINDWKSFEDYDTRNSGLDVFFVDLLVNSLPVGGKVIFTLYWTQEQKWEEKNYEISIVQQ